LPVSWKETLSETLSQSKKDKRLTIPRTCLIGVGSDLRGDDSAGLVVARTLLEDASVNKISDILILEGGPAPENHTGKIRAFQPDLVLIIDAAHLDATPGTIQWIPLDSIDGMSASSHSLPLSVLAHFLKLELSCDIAILGIQPEQNEIGGELSPCVHAAVNAIVSEISTFYYSHSQIRSIKT
jgi:hydrogenase 3 maturation protease